MRSRFYRTFWKVGLRRDVSVLILADAHSAAEEDLLSEWAAQRYPDAEVRPTSKDSLKDLVAVGDALSIIPVRVVWVPSEDGASRFSEILALGPPTRPWRLMQRRIARLHPGRFQIAAGTAVTLGELRDRFAANIGAAGGQFDEFVLEHAEIESDRAERQVVGDRYKVPRLRVKQITDSVTFRQSAGSVAERLGIGLNDMVRRAEESLSEMVAVQSPIAAELFRSLMSHMHSRAWNVEVDQENLEKIRQIGENGSLVFLPSHRSYADSLVLAEVLQQKRFPRNHVLGGKNLSFWPMGAIGRRAGVVFIRRSFGDDLVYKFSLRQYLGLLLSKELNMEWYIEGGRTRTGKLRHPKYGLLRYLVDALDAHPDRDAYLAPVSMVYDQMPEVGALVAEQHGLGKHREGLLWLARYIKQHRQMAGTVRVSFGEPFSLRAALEEAGPEGPTLEKVAFRVCAAINAVTPYTTTSIVTCALLSGRRRAQTFGEIQSLVTTLLDYFHTRGIAGPAAELSSTKGLQRVLDQLQNVGVVNCYTDGADPVWAIAEGHYHAAAFYRNGALHHLVYRAIIEMAIFKVIDEPSSSTMPLKRGYDEALRLRNLLKFEFFFSPKPEFRRELAAELELITPNWRDGGVTIEDAAKLFQSLRPLVAPLVLRPFLEAQFVLADRLVARPVHAGQDTDGLVAECLAFGRQLLLQGKLTEPDSVSRELYATALKLADNRKLFADSADTLSKRRAYLAEVAEYLEHLDAIAEFQFETVEGSAV